MTPDHLLATIRFERDWDDLTLEEQDAVIAWLERCADHLRTGKWYPPLRAFYLNEPAVPPVEAG